MTTRTAKKVSKVMDSMVKSGTWREKDMNKFIDLFAADYGELYAPETFKFFEERPLEADNTDVMKLLISVIESAGPMSQCVAMNVVTAFVQDARSRERFLLGRIISVVMPCVAGVSDGTALGELVAINALRLMRVFVEDRDFLQDGTEAKSVLSTLLKTSTQCNSKNEVLLRAFGACLMPFYTSGHFDINDQWTGKPIATLVMAAQNRDARIHKEIAPTQVQREQEIFSSPLCKVYRGSMDGQVVAIKQFSQLSLGFTWEDFYKEVGLLCVTQHPNVIKVYGAHTNNGKSEEPFLVTEFCENGNLHDCIEKIFAETGASFPYTRIISIALDIAKALAYLHSLGIIHRDVKTENFLVADDYSVKMIDFGVSRVISQSVIMTTVGTPTFMAPEVLNGDMYTDKADVYGYGMVLYEVLSGKEPFHDTPALSIAKSVVSGQRPPLPSLGYDELEELLCACWHNEQQSRPSFKDVMVALLRLKNKPPPAAAMRAQSARGIDIKSAIRAGNKSLRNYEWYYGQLSKDDACTLLEDQDKGTFLVRDSSRPGCYAATVVFDEGIRHILIQPGEKGRYVVDALDNRNYNFKSIPAVVKSYSNILVIPCQKPDDL